ncbi:thioesterase II family protein [Dactylosporangium cerinum]|uniref:Thioesterase II family protein n=1 Tax=Dactylosporangium cerinum TaxID=1434730 RepID=A0ABV9VZ44_9ACTN
MSAFASGSQWLRNLFPTAKNDARLMCFPHAGGAASYYLPMAKALASVADVTAIQYPGRQDRRSESPIGDIGTLADRIVEVLDPIPGERPVAFFGHSMGAVVAFEVARRLEDLRANTPVVLFASGRRAPSIQRQEAVGKYSDDGLIAEIRALDGTNSSMLHDDELVRMILPAVRADYRAIESYVCAPEAVIARPIVAILGTEDPRVSLSDAQAWESHTTGKFDLHTLPGNHFYINGHLDELRALVRSGLDEFSAFRKL